MSVFYKVIVIGLILFSGCKTPQLADSYELEQIRSNMEAQQAAWNSGSLDDFMAYYWKSPELSFIGSRGITRGWQQSLDNYVKAYPDKATMGRLAFEVLELRALGKESAYMIGKYTLYREMDQPSGYFNLIWEKKNGQWVVTSDHTGG